jgi:hypothetical protein
VCTKGLQTLGGAGRTAPLSLSPGARRRAPRPPPPPPPPGPPPRPASVASPKLVTEEAPESYKDVSAVVDTCQAAGISKRAIKLRPIGVVKG